ncbi:conserved membrane hypothetical protein [Desulfamplus magnetovallimortis]|uniref:Diadenylate cyclase n=1 Tax=Desulfamplus magnetovallimortis TaxID=1246637 RepID=A0A1W1H533_9BACT|nr:diadenylate cyclase [Desulfamplus magnetovallimortis]SLM27593.1 conserved membrane hypothetical protein [Desulfamplus magnetovallimortis]
MDNILNFLSTMRWQDFIDIFLNTYIIFRLYVLLKGSRLIRIVPAAALLWIMRTMALYMGLVVTTWAIQGIIAAAAIILIIVFRDDIASIFQSKNPLSFFWGFPSRKTSTPIEIIARSTFELAAKRIGALMVFPGKQHIDEYIQKGIEWGGKITEQMLMTIFWDKNPVHDGAIIIKGNKVTEVSVILPLSKKEDMPSKYGTRHRAAAGMCEVSDALVIAVSEERGHVTVASKSGLEDVKSIEALQEILTNHTGEIKKRGIEYWKEIIEFGIAGIVCLSMITGLWFGLSRGKETLKTINVPVEYTDIKQGFDIIKASTSTVELHLSGSMPLLKSLKPENIKVLLKLGGATVGSNTFKISNDSIVLPPGVNLKKAEPGEVELVMGGVAYRKVPVQIDWSGKLAENIIIESAVPDPAFIDVTGVSPGIENLTTLYTEKVPLESITEPASSTLQTGIVVFPSSIKIPEKAKTLTIKYTAVQRTEGEMDASR